MPEFNLLLNIQRNLIGDLIKLLLMCWNLINDWIDFLLTCWNLICNLKFYIIIDIWHLINDFAPVIFSRFIAYQFVKWVLWLNLKVEEYSKKNFRVYYISKAASCGRLKLSDWLLRERNRIYSISIEAAILRIAIFVLLCWYNRHAEITIDIINIDCVYSFFTWIHRVYMSFNLKRPALSSFICL